MGRGEGAWVIRAVIQCPAQRCEPGL